MEGAWDSRGVEDIKRQCIHHFAWTFVNEKAMFKVGATFAHSQLKTMRQWSEHCLQLFQRNKKEFSHKYVTMDETWIHHFTPESNQQSGEWTAAGENHPVGKALAYVFWDVQGILFIDYLEKGRTINSEYHIALLVSLKEGIAEKWPQTKKKKWSFTNTMHCVTSGLQNYMNCTSNCFRTHPILQIWPPTTTGCLQTTKECFRKRDLVPIGETEPYFQAKDKLFYKKKKKKNTDIKLLEKHWNQCITPKEDLMNKVKFCLLVRPRTYWVMYYKQLKINTFKHKVNIL